MKKYKHDYILLFCLLLISCAIESEKNPIPTFKINISPSPVLLSLHPRLNR